MMKSRILLSLGLVLIMMQLNAQVTISGTVYNEQGEPLELASVFLDDNIHGSVTDENGAFELVDIPVGVYLIKVTFLSYTPFEKEINISKSQSLDIVLKGDAMQLDALEIISSRVGIDHPIAHTDVNKQTIERNDFGQDMPMILEHTPSLVTTSDAGNGVGYTSMRIRGFDVTRINVTINGVPLNDPESQAVFFVDIPDLLSSTKDIQVQRGVGSSTNGPGAFGASVSVDTKTLRVNPYADITLGFGSYNTKRISGAVGTGLMLGKYSVDFRYSNVSSDGYLDRATSDLNSYYLSAARITEKSSLRFITFSGHERTYQAWYGTPKEKLFGTEEGLLNHYQRNKGGIYKTKQDSINLFSSGRTYNYYQYENQVDDYVQSHYQLHYARLINSKFNITSALYATLGKGYYEEFKYKAKYKDYLMSDAIFNGDTISRGDIVRRRNLNNYLVGSFINGQYKLADSGQLDFGISGSTYKGLHTGNVLSAEFRKDLDTKKNYYYNEGVKQEAVAYVKYKQSIVEGMDIFGDFQVRHVGYATIGTDNDQQHFDIDKKFIFINPKIGLSYKWNPLSSVNMFFGISNKEPSRNDFVDVEAGAVPRPEHIQDYELSYRFAGSKLSIDLNGFYMNYIDQLVLRGDLNDVGASIRVNVDKSYRAGIELSAAYKPIDKLLISYNTTISKNRIKTYEEKIADYDNGDLVSTIFEDTPIAFSPDLTGSLGIDYELLDGLHIGWRTKAVSEQFIDNTGDKDKLIQAYSFSDAIINYEYKSSWMKSINFGLKVANIFNTHYASNAYTYSYIWGEKITETFYYPQAERNVSLTVRVKL